MNSLPEPYEFYFLGEEDYYQFLNSITPGSSKNISFCGKLVSYNAFSYMGYIEYQNKRIHVNFGRVANFLQVKISNDKDLNSLYFVYGFIQKEPNGEPICTCNLIRYVTDFDNNEYKALVKRRRQIIREADEIGKENSFWY